MGRDLKADFKGLVTAPGLLMRAEASCVQATNLLFDAPGVVRKRRGFARLAGNAGGPVWSLFASRNLGSAVLAHIGASAPQQLRTGDGSGTLSAITMMGGASITRTSAKRAAMAVSERNHYVTASEGVARIESSLASLTQRFAGIPRGLGGFWGSAQLAAGTLLAIGYARAYRVTWHLDDADGVEMGGAPTGRMVIRNSLGLPGYAAGTMDAKITSLLPVEMSSTTAISGAYSYRIWATRTWDADGGANGDDEMFLIAENKVSATDISNGYAQYLDATPDSFLTRQRRLHTNATNFPESELGIAQGTVNEDAPPPVASALAYWQDVMWYGDLQWRSRLQVRLLVTGGSGLVADDKITITDSAGVSIIMTAKASPAAGDEFNVYSGLATTQLDVEATALAFVSAYNLEAIATGGTCRAYYVSVGTSAPGVVYFEDMKATGTSIEYISNRPAAFSPTDAGGLGGSNDARSNALAFSKAYRADAVPPINLFAAGPGDARILKLHPYRNTLLVFTDYGIYQVTGRSYADFSVFPFDLGFKLMVRESVVTCDEKVYAWCYEGIIEIDSGGVTVISTPIEPTLADILLAAGTTPGSGGVAGGQSAFASLGYAVAYRYEHRVLFFYPEANDATNINGCALWLNFDTRTRAWSQGQLTTKIGATFLDNRSAGVVRWADDRLTLGNWSTGADTFLFLERRDYAATDYADTLQNGTLVPISSTLKMQYAVPDVSGGVHWQQVVLAFDAGEYTWRPPPTALTLAYRVQPNNVTASTAMAANTLHAWRAETPTDVRRGSRLQLTITHETAEYFGLVGLAQWVREGTKFIGRSE